MSGNDYLKFVIEKIILYASRTSEEKKTRKESDKQNYTFYRSKWLGILPFTLKIIFNKENSRY